MNDNAIEKLIRTWSWRCSSDDYYQNGYDAQGYDRKGFAPDGLDRFGFTRSGYLDACGGFRRRDLSTTRDGRGNRYAYVGDGIVVFFPRKSLTYYDDWNNCYHFYENASFGPDSINYRFYDSYADYKEHMSGEDDYDYSDLYALYDEGFGGSDWGI